MTAARQPAAALAATPAPADGATAAACAPVAPFAVEATPIGPQSLVPGVAPITARDRLVARATAPLEARSPQRPCDLGLFDMNARNQLDLFQPPQHSDDAVRRRSLEAAPPKDV